MKKKELTGPNWFTKEPKVKRKIALIADGGCKSAGDIVKSLVFGDMVMTGNMVAGTDEADGHTFELNGVSYKEYNGSSTHKENHIEGVHSMVSKKGPVVNVIDKIMQGVRSGCSYQGAFNLQELKEKAKFVRITGAGLKESGPHDVLVIK
jgi:IMP dehydrogenase